MGDGHFLFGVGNEYLRALLLVLKEAVDDTFDYIGWWLYETNDYQISTHDNTNEMLSLRREDKKQQQQTALGKTGDVRAMRFIHRRFCESFLLYPPLQILVITATILSVFPRIAKMVCSPLLG